MAAARKPDVDIVVTAGPDLAARLDKARGGYTRAGYVGILLDRVLPRSRLNGDEDTEEGLRKLMLPLEPERRMTVEEIGKVMDLPPIPKIGSAFDQGRAGDVRRLRCHWMIAMENYGYSAGEIAFELGFAGAAGAKHYLNAYLKSLGDKPAAEHRAELRDDIAWLLDRAKDKLDNPPVMYSVTGNPLTDPRTGEWATDDTVFWRGVDSITKLLSRKAAVDGADWAVSARAAVDQADYQLKIDALFQLASEKTLALESAASPAGSEVDGQAEEPGEHEGDPVEVALGNVGQLEDESESEGDDSSNAEHVAPPADQLPA